MKRFVTGVIFMSLVGLLLSCATVSAPQRTIPSLSRDVTPRANESEVLVQNASSLINGLLNVIINGELVAQVDQNGTERIIVPNGKHSIVVQAVQGGQRTNTLEFTANSNRTVFKTSSIYLYLAIVFRLNQEGQFALGSTGGTTSIEGALERAAEEVAENFTARSRIAIVYITAQDRSTTDFISGELEHILRQRGFVIIDRSELDRIRAEQQFGLSGEVDDSTAAEIGHIAGASIVITGRVDGEGNLQRLRLRALETSSGQVIGTASERL
jgi:hypothetical protein